MTNKAASEEHVTSETAVWWDINNCPIPDGYDPRCVGPSIDSALMNLGYKGPLTIIAIGNLDGTSRDVLEALSSTGIVIKHDDFGHLNFLADVAFCWKLGTGLPATLMIISDPIGVKGFSHVIKPSEGTTDEYNLLVAYSPNSSLDQLCPHTHVLPSAKWFWSEDSLLKALSAQETRRPDSADKSPMFSCKLCLFDANSVQAFTKHLSSDLHALKPLPVNVKKQTKNFIWRSKRQQRLMAKSKAKKGKRKHISLSYTWKTKKLLMAMGKTSS